MNTHMQKHPKRFNFFSLLYLLCVSASLVEELFMEINVNVYLRSCLPFVNACVK